ncbi:MAG: PAS domain S-box protein [Chitinispirillaceae bacterium]|nr:PAS domain S-box protein [Chitinispirillaceae bacterium]
MSATVEANTTRGRGSLAFVLAGAFLGVTMTVLLITHFPEMYYAFRNQRSVIDNIQNYIARDAADKVRNYLRQKVSIMEGVAYLEDLAAAPKRERQLILEKLLGLEPAFRHLLLFDGNDRELAGISRHSFRRKVRFKGLVEREVVPRMRQGEVYMGSIHVDEVTSEPMVVIAVPVTDIFGDQKGALIAEVNLKFMWDMIAGIKVGKNGTAYVIDRQGTLLAFSDISRVLKGERLNRLKGLSDFIGNADSPDSKTGLFKGINGKYVASNYVPLGTPDWAVVTEMPVIEAYETVILQLTAMLLLMLLGVAVAVATGIILSRRIAKPIIDLRNAASKIGKGRFDICIEAEKGTAEEIAELAQSINRMAYDLRQTTTSIDSLNREIEERTKAENELRRSEASVRSIHRAAPVGIAVARNRTMLTVNRHICEITGYTEENLLGRDIGLFFESDDEYRRVGTALDGTVVPKEHAAVEAKFRRRDGKGIDVLLTSVMIEGTDQTVITITDITPQKDIQEQLRKKNLETLEFANAVTHDLRKPLTTMILVMDMAEKGAFGALNDDGVEAIGNGLKAAQYMQELLEDLIACAKLETGTQELTIETTGFKELSEAVLAGLKYQIEEKKIIVETASGDVTFNADKKQLTRALMNLVGNAVTYIGSGPDRRIRIGWERRNGAPVFFVEDNGMGIPRESQEHLFRKFKRGSNVRGISGTGLGLFIVKGIIEAHGGTVWFESEAGKGTTFRFTLGGDYVNVKNFDDGDRTVKP